LTEADQISGVSSDLAERGMYSFRDRAIVLPETTFDEPSREGYETMARRRFQHPKPQREENFWWLFPWQDEFVNGKRIRKRKRVKLAPASMPEREVRKIAAEILRPLNQGLVTIGSATKFADFVAEVYESTVLPLMASSTQDRYKGVIKNYLTPTFGELCLRDVSALAVQRYFSGMAKSEVAHESRDKIKDVLSSILGSAVQYGLLVKNPAEGSRLPPSKKGRASKPYIPPERFMIWWN
jgi:hypothetical protein